MEIPMLLLEVRTKCPPHSHTFQTVPTTGAVAVLCDCESAILTGANGIMRVEVLG